MTMGGLSVGVRPHAVTTQAELSPIAVRHLAFRSICMGQLLV